LVLIKASYYPKSMFVGIIMLGFSLKKKTYNALGDMINLMVHINYLPVCIHAEIKRAECKITKHTVHSNKHLP
jgi:hypothetical protein